MNVTIESFSSVNDPSTYSDISKKFTIKGNAGYCAEVINYGARIYKLFVPDKKTSKTADIVLGPKDLDGYLADGANHGAVVGRSANRIAGAKFTIDGVSYSIPQNDGTNNLHTGDKAYQFKFWDNEVLDKDRTDRFIESSGIPGLFDNEDKRSAGESVLFSCISEDGENGFPGKLKTDVLYAWLQDDTFLILYRGESDKKTVFAPTNHAYFNISGHDKGYVGNQLLTMDCDKVTLKGSDNCPNGEYLDVDGTPFDFRNESPVSKCLDLTHPQICDCKGIDQNFCLNNGGRYAKVCVLKDDKSSRIMETWTDLPGIQLYAGNHLDSSDNKDGAVYKQFDALCIEAQMYPNAVNIPGFDSPVIAAGVPKFHACGYRFI